MSFRLLAIFVAFLALSLPATANKPRGARDLTFIYMRDTNDSIMSGDMKDLERVRKVVKKGERALWFRTDDNKEFIVRDAALLAQFEGAWKTANALAEQMGEIGGKQGIIGTKQGTIGMKQGAIGLQQGALATKESELLQREDAAKTDAQRDAIAKKRRAIEAQRRELDRKMDELDDQMRELDKPMRALEVQMAAIEKKHDVAQKQAHLDTEALLARAITTGVAKPF